MEAVSKLDNLKYLNLYADAEISDKGFNYLCNGLKGKKLAFLDLCGCKFFSNQNLIDLSAN